MNKLKRREENLRKGMRIWKLREADTACDGPTTVNVIRVQPIICGCQGLKL